jgi:hypothetical protein
MTLRTLSAVAFAAGLLAANNAYAQQQVPTGAPDLNVVPDKMPFATPLRCADYDGAGAVVDSGCRGRSQ